MCSFTGSVSHRPWLRVKVEGKSLSLGKHWDCRIHSQISPWMGFTVV